MSEEDIKRQKIPRQEFEVRAFLIEKFGLAANENGELPGNTKLSILTAVFASVLADSTLREGTTVDNVIETFSKALKDGLQQIRETKLKNNPQIYN